ncbi:MAG: hypothetical protein ACO26C_07610 [Ilumatobacteraceae bacterium]|jgi:hypothetical protein
MATTDPVLEWIGVYDADATLRGELAYWIGARLGTRHCALCDVTHGLVRERAAWRACAARLPAPFTTHHRDDAPADVREAAAGRYPVVLARTAGGLRVALDAAAIEACGGSPEELARRLGA